MTSRASADTALALSARLRIVAEHEAVVFYRRSAAGGVDHDRVEPAGLDLTGPRQDVGAREGVTVLAEVMVERAAAASALGDHDLAAVPGQEADRRLVDLRRQHLLRASGRAARRGARLADALGTTCGRSKAERSGAASGRDRAPRATSSARGRRTGFAERAGRQGEAKGFWTRQDEAEDSPKHPVEPGTAIGLLDVMPRVVDEVHVVRRPKGRSSCRRGRRGSGRYA